MASVELTCGWLSAYRMAADWLTGCRLPNARTKEQSRRPLTWPVVLGHFFELRCQICYNLLLPRVPVRGTAGRHQDHDRHSSNFGTPLPGRHGVSSVEAMGSAKWHNRFIDMW